MEAIECSVVVVVVVAQLLIVTRASVGSLAADWVVEAVILPSLRRM